MVLLIITQGKGIISVPLSSMVSLRHLVSEKKTNPQLTEFILTHDMSFFCDIQDGEDFLQVSFFFVFPFSYSIISCKLY